MLQTFLRPADAFPRDKGGRLSSRLAANECIDVNIADIERRFDDNEASDDKASDDEASDADNARENKNGVKANASDDDNYDASDDDNRANNDDNGSGDNAKDDASDDNAREDDKVRGDRRPPNWKLAIVYVKFSARRRQRRQRRQLR